MRIKQIYVSGLFGIFDHVIPLNTDERITIIHGLNGFGKTNILRILNGLFNSQYEVFNSIPFKKFQVNLEDESILEIEKKISNPVGDQEIDIIFNFYRENSEKLSFDPLNDIDLHGTSGNVVNHFSNIFIGSLIAKNITQNDIVNYDNIREHSRLFNSSKEPDWLKKLKHSISIRLIESQRLLDIRSGISSSTVSAYSDEIAEIMRDKFAEYGRISQSLDRTFPIRAVQQKNVTDLTDEQLRYQLNELENTRTRLIELGLLDQDENPDFPNQLQEIDESTRNILSVYVEDAKKKLNVFNTLASKIELLRKIINHKFAYSYKEMNFSKEQGFLFTTCYPNSSESDSKTVSSTDLSSGEKHELVLLYELLFKVEPNSLVLIDEPELSLYVGWQSQFLKDLQEITELADLDILMATHSPDIIQREFGISQNLYCARILKI